tara:strand:+ start:197 stop:775 length:579 start_codon:yes stop_codon:yes gene_type:complete
MPVKYIEISGQACCGKSYHVSRIENENNISFVNTYPKKIIYFFIGGFFLGLRKLLKLYSFSNREKVPYFFKINIFINAVSKFGLKCVILKEKSLYNKTITVDEGISHLPFLFLNTNSSEIIDFIKDFIESVEVHFIKSPGFNEILTRMDKRGHKRLNFISSYDFIKKNHEIELVLLDQYPKILKNNFRLLNK